jgi:16S rRNA (adenine1518-N6/adenine1519-N6)-dimethyltransferase
VVAAKRYLGQHFLSDPRILGRIGAALQALPGDRVIEIGPGRGGLTRVLLGAGLRVTAIERDSALAGELGDRFPEARVLEADALEVDWPAALGVAPGDRWFVTGNIPYNITSPLIDQALRPPRPTRIVYLVQREVADRLIARPGTAQYGALTAGVQAQARVERLFAVPAGAFRPRPRVESAAVRLTPLAEPLVADAEMASFHRLVRALFGARRKQLVRALRTALHLPARRAEETVRALGLDPERRPETLSPAELVALHRHVVDGGEVAL